MSPTDELTIGVLLPDVLGTYSDAGNAVVLAHRALARGVEARIHPITADTPRRRRVISTCSAGARTPPRSSPSTG